MPSGATLNLDNLHIYVRGDQISGTIVGGSVTSFPRAVRSLSTRPRRARSPPSARSMIGPFTVPLANRLPPSLIPAAAAHIRLCRRD